MYISLSKGIYEQNCTKGNTEQDRLSSVKIAFVRVHKKFALRGGLRLLRLAEFVR